MLLLMYVAVSCGSQRFGFALIRSYAYCSLSIFLFHFPMMVMIVIGNGEITGIGWLLVDDLEVGGVKNFVMLFEWIKMVRF